MKTIEARIATETRFRNGRHVYEPSVRRSISRGLYRSDRVLHDAKKREKRADDARMLSEDRVRELVTRAETDGYADSLFTVVTNDIRRVSPALSTYDEVMADKPSIPISVSWGVPCIVNGVKVNGMYRDSDTQGYITITAQEPTPAERLITLGTRGILPAPDQTHLHEKTHAMQFDVAGQIFPELIEAHAYRSTQITVAEFSAQALTDHVTRSKAYKDVDRRKFTFAVWSIDRLKALGLRSEEELAELIGEPGKWNEKYGLWENVEGALEADIVNFGMDTMDVERAVMLQDLEDATAFHEARNTTQGNIFAYCEANLQPAALANVP